MNEAELQEEYVDIQDERTGEIIPIIPQPPKPGINTLHTELDLNKVGTLVLDEKAEAVLGEPLKEEDVKIRPDGLVYLPWTWYNERLNRAFGRLGWGLIPQSSPQSKDLGNNMVLVAWGHWFLVKGTVVGFEIGGCTYRSNNNKMSYDDAAAGAKSNSLARNCKMLGMSLELWDSEWVSKWKKKYAETYENPKTHQTEWRKKGARRQEQPAPEQQPEVKATVETQDEQTENPSAKAYTVKALKDFPVVKAIAEKAGKKPSDVVEVIVTLNTDSKYTIQQVVSKLTGVQNVSQ